MLNYQLFDLMENLSLCFPEPSFGEGFFPLVYPAFNQSNEITRTNVYLRARVLVQGVGHLPAHLIGSNQPDLDLWYSIWSSEHHQECRVTCLGMSLNIIVCTLMMFKGVLYRCASPSKTK